MLYVFTGDRQKARTKLEEIRGLLAKKRPEAEVFKIDADSFSNHDLSELAQSQGLFEQKNIVELDSLFAEASADPDTISLLAESDNAFLVYEEKPDKKLGKLFKSHAESVFDFPSTGGAAGKEFSAFTLADALGAKDKKKLWILFREAVSRGYALEEIHGILFWQAKMILLASGADSAEEAGVKQFPYSKAKRFSKNFAEGEAEMLLSSFTDALVESRGKNISLEHTLERTILSI